MGEEINIVCNKLTEEGRSLVVAYAGTFGAAAVKGVVTFSGSKDRGSSELLASGWTHNGPPGFAEAGQAHAERAAARFIKTDPAWSKATVVDSQMLRARNQEKRDAQDAEARKEGEEKAARVQAERERAFDQAQKNEPKPAFIPGAKMRAEAREKAARNTL